ncbi:hypothetical protein [Agromyces sp. SYSU T00194]|uniref:hypothetical protein n=1 Tax=Agromyces chitinivorans TaxID=3158560 RepID=UPI003396BFCB
MTETRTPVLYETGTHVIVTEFIRNGDEKTEADLDGWVTYCDAKIIIIANTPDFADLVEGDDYFQARFNRDRVLVTPVGERGASDVFVVLFAAAAAVFAVGVLGRSWQLLVVGVWAFVFVLFLLRWVHPDPEPSNSGEVS